MLRKLHVSFLGELGLATGRAYPTNGGRIDEQHRHEQEKMVKHQHLLANMVILHNAQAMTQALNDMKTRGDEINEELLRHLSPYRTSHINRLGEYQVNVKRTTSPITCRAI